MDDANALMPLILQFAQDRSGLTMAQRHGPQDHDADVRMLERIGLPIAQLETLEPWFFSVSPPPSWMGRRGWKHSRGLKAC